MKAAYYAGNGRIEVRDCADPVPGEGEVLVRMRASAVCGSELHAYRSAQGDSGIAGHEGVGEVVHGGAGLAAGQLVAIQVFSGCGNCLWCASGAWEHCAQAHFHGGTHAEYMAVAAVCCLPVPAGIAPEDAVLLGGDTIGTPYHVISRMGVSAADTVAVLGCGPIGLGSIAVLEFLGARILAVEPAPYRRNLAEQLGAEKALDPAAGDPVAAIRAMTGGQGATVVLDCCGEAVTTGQALDIAAIGGKVAFIGEKPEAVIRPSDHCIRKELTVYGTWYFTGPDYYRMLDLYHRGLDLTGLVSHQFAFSRADEAFALFAARETGKVVLVHP